MPVAETGPVPAETPAAEEAREAQVSAGGEASSNADASTTYGDQNSAAEGLLELSNAGEIV